MTSRTALTVELERLANSEASLARHIETNETEQKRREKLAENLKARIADAEFNLARLRSKRTKVVHFESFRDLRLALRKAQEALVKAEADIKTRERMLIGSRTNLDKVREQRETVEGKLVPFPTR
jgi:multidrug resistance efflux pump